MICKAVKEDINSINYLGKLLYDNFENTYFVNKYIDDNNYIVIVSKDNKINGFLLVYKNYDFYEIEIIVVDKEYRNKGIATGLLNYFFENYCKNDDTILLEVSCENESALDLYKKLGFNTISIRKKYYNGIDAYVMKKVIV